MVSASIATGKLTHAQQLISQVGVASPAHASQLLGLLFNQNSSAEASVIELAEQVRSSSMFFQILVLTHCVVQLLPHADPCARDSSGYTLLHKAIANKHSTNVLTFLLNHYQSSKRILEVVSIVDNEKRSPLHTAVLHKNIALVRQLLAICGAAKSEAAQGDKTTTFLQFINMVDSNGATALHYALQTNALGAYRDSALVRVLCAAGANPLFQDKQGLSPALIVGGLPANYLPSMCRALAGEAEDDDEANKEKKPKRELAPEVKKVIDEAQAKRVAKDKESEAKRQKKLAGREAGVKKLQKMMEQFRKSRESNSKEAAVNEAEQREKAKKGLLGE